MANLLLCREAFMSSFPMMQPQGYVLGQSAHAARRLEIQDIQFAEVSEWLLEELSLRQHDRVVELGCGPGGFSRRILRRLGEGGCSSAWTPVRACWRKP